MYITEFDKDPSLHSVLLNPGRETVRVARALGLFHPKGGLKLLAGMVWQGPEYRGIAIDTAGLQDIQEKARKEFPEITTYLSGLALPAPETALEAVPMPDTQAMPLQPSVESAPAA